MQKADARANSALPAEPWHTRSMARVVPRFSLLFFLVALVSQGCDCDCGSTTNGNGDGDVDGMVGDGNVGDGSGDVDALVDGNQADVPPYVPPDVHVLLTADNAYGFGYGSASAIQTYFMGVEDGSDDIFLCSQACGPSLPPCAVGDCDAFGTCDDDRGGPETYIVPGNTANVGDYLYVVTWSDELSTQGLVGQFRASDGSNTVYTGDDRWEVCATGDDIDPTNADPSVAFINTHIVACNAGVPLPVSDSGSDAGTPENPSNGWISTSLGNNPDAMNRGLVVLPPAMDGTIGRFDELCRKPLSMTGDAVDPEAAWMWYDNDTTMAPTAFDSNGQTRGDFLIFRLPLSAVIIIE